MIKVRTTKRKDGCITATAYAGRTRIGKIQACEAFHSFDVGAAEVVDDHRRQGVGTRMYEALAKLACSLGKPLGSYTYQQSQMARGFWQKQVNKGRAQFRRWEEFPEGSGRIRGHIQLKCPVESLGRRRRR